MRIPTLLAATAATLALAAPAGAELIVLAEQIVLTPRADLAVRVDLTLNREPDLFGNPGPAMPPVDAYGYYFGSDPATFDPAAVLTAPDVAIRSHELRLGRGMTFRLGPAAGVDPTPGADGLGPLLTRVGWSVGRHGDGRGLAGFDLAPEWAALVSGRPYALYTFEGGVPTLARAGTFPAIFAAIPEPATIGLMGLGLAGALAAAACRRAGKSAR